MPSINHQCFVPMTELQNLLVPNSNNSIFVEFANINYTVRHHCKEKRKTILDSIDGYLRPGKLTAIVGPSGAGKTSLLNIISGHKQSSNSDALVKINGTKINIETYRQSVSYVPQDVTFLPLLTVYETLLVAARFKLNKNHPIPREDAVQNVIQTLGLEKCVDTLIRDLSGGEKKRLSIGLEIITSPSVLLMDEPTTGLDSSACNQVVQLLRVLVEQGCTVACTIHQPSSKIISQFDEVILIAEGKCYYCGPQQQLFSTFKDAGFTCPQYYNIAEFVLEVITGQRDGNLEQLYINYKKSHHQRWLQTEDKNKAHDSTDGQNKQDKYSKFSISKKRFKTTTWEQTMTLFYRAFISIKRDKTLSKLRLAAHIVVGILLGIVFYDFGQDAAKVESNVSCIFFLSIFLFFANSMPAVQMFPIESAVLLRENLNNWYSLHAYHITKVLSDLPLQILCSTLFLVTSYSLTSQPFELLRFFQVWTMCTLITILAQTFGIAIGAAFNTHIGMFLVPALNIPMLLFAGFFVKLPQVSIYLQIFSTTSYFRYAFEGSIQAIYGHDRPTLACSTDYCHLRSPQRILSELGMPSVSYEIIVTVLLLWILILHIFIHAVLRWRVYVSTK